LPVLFSVVTIMHMFLLQHRRLTKIRFRGTSHFNIFDKSFACVTVNVVWKLALEGLHAVRSFLHPLQLIQTSGQPETQLAQMVRDCSVDNSISDKAATCATKISMDRGYPKHWMSTTERKHTKEFVQGPSQNRSTIFTYKMVKLYHTKLEDLNLMYVCPCIIYEIDERYPHDATIYLLL